MAKIKAHADQSRTLAALRDTLLPKLLSGELNVRKHEHEQQHDEDDDQDHRHNHWAVRSAVVDRRGRAGGWA
jgi:hypothetical protein